MSEKVYLVTSDIISESWIVKAHTVKGAIVEALAHLKPKLDLMESILKHDLELDLKVKEIKDTVTDLGRKPYKYHV